MKDSCDKKKSVGAKKDQPEYKTDKGFKETNKSDKAIPKGNEDKWESDKYKKN